MGGVAEDLIGKISVCNDMHKLLLNEIVILSLVAVLTFYRHFGQLIFIFVVHDTLGEIIFAVFK